jgi:ATP-dependent DNA helicase DinG
MLTLHEIFTEVLPEILEGYVHRPVQLSLAENIMSIIQSASTGVFEAGTGTGKTLSYLVPAFLADGKVIISTGTKNLQDQLYRKDIPMLHPLFPQKRVALLKGRANYLCTHRLKTQLKLKQRHKTLESQLVDVRTWSAQTRSGDLTEIIDLDEQPELVRLVTSTRDNCLGTRCPDYNDCAVYRAREYASQSDIIVINHHLLFADLSQTEDHLHALLPKATALIVDEAHQVPDTARQFFGQRISSGQMNELVRDVKAELTILGNDDPVTLTAVTRLETQHNHLKNRVLGSEEQDFNRWCSAETTQLIHDVDHALADLGDQLARVGVRSEGLAQCARRTLGFADQFAILTEQTELEDEYVHWIDRSEKGYVIHLSPLPVASEIRTLVNKSSAAWVFTSATLSVNRKFDHYLGEMGLDGEIAEIFDSPFDYASSVRAHILNDLPEPGRDAHTIALVEQTRPIINANPGRTFFLFTSHRALRLAAELMADSPRQVFVQGTMAKSQLLAAFKRTSGSVLLATQSFWEGVDVRGAELKLLIIDKLPFPSPGDPLYEARAEAIRNQGGNSFKQLALPKTVLSLKQGFGRLIREETDRGLFVLGDSRMKTRSYKNYVKNNLPEMQWLEQSEEAIKWLRKL